MYTECSFVILIPAYKPNSALEQLTLDLTNILPDTPIIIVNDGSPSNFDDIFNYCNNFSNVHIIKNAVNIGKGAALKNGINYILNEFQNVEMVITADADGQHHPKDIFKIAETCKKNPNSFILGYRKFDDKTPFRSRIGNTFSKFFYSFLLGIRLNDTQTGLRALPFELLKETLLIKSNRYELETEQLILSKKLKLKIVQVPIQTIYIDDNKSSHFNPLFDSIRIYFALIRYSISSLTVAFIDFSIFVISVPLIQNIITCNILSRLISLFIQYFLLRNFVFKQQKKVDYIQFLLFFIYCITMGYLSGVIQCALVESYSLNIILTKILVETILFFFNFLFLRDILFSNSK